MNKYSFLLIVSIFAIFFHLTSVSCLPSLQLKSESYQPYETLTGLIEGTTTEIVKKNIKFFQERRELSVDKEVFNYQNKSYFYIRLPSNEGTYRIEIKDLDYNENGTIGRKNIIQEVRLKINNASLNGTEIIAIVPGVLDSYLPNASLYITNVGTKAVSIEYLYDNFSISSGETRKMNLYLNKSFDLLAIKSYRDFEIPLIYRGSVETNITTNQTEEPNQTIEEVPYSINLTSTMDFLKLGAVVGKTETYNITIINLGDSLENITLMEEKKVLNLSLTTIDYFENKSVIQISFSVKFDAVQEIETAVKFFLNETEILSITITFEVFENENIYQQYFNDTSQQKGCNELGGKICASNENCEGDYIYSGGLCCLGKCNAVKENKSNPLNLVAGIIIFLIVAAGIYYFYIKIKNVKGQTPEEKIKQIEGTRN
jgi:hypothetical protein